MKITDKQYKQIKKEFLKKTGIKIRYTNKWYNKLKRNIAEKELKAIGVTKVNDILSERFIQVSVGKNNYLMCPRKLNKPIIDLAMLTHEYMHVLQKKRIGKIKYKYYYLTDKTARCLIEAEAYASSFDVYNLLGHSFRNDPNIIFDDNFERIYCVSQRRATKAIRKYNEIVSLDKEYKTKASELMCEIILKVCKK